MKNIYRLDKTNIEEHIVRSSFANDIQSYVTLSEFSTRLQISSQNLQAIQLFSLFDKVFAIL